MRDKTFLANEIVPNTRPGKLRALAQPDLRNRLATQGTDPASPTHTQFHAFMAAGHQRYGEVARGANISRD